MTKVHYLETVASGKIKWVGQVELHKTSHSGYVNGVEAASDINLVDCKVCLKKLSA